MRYESLDHQHYPALNASHGHNDVKYPRVARTLMCDLPNPIFTKSLPYLTNPPIINKIFSNPLSFIQIPCPFPLVNRTQFKDTMAPNDNFISRGIQSGVAAAGSFAGGVVDSAGKTVQNSGRGIGNSFVSPEYKPNPQLRPSILPSPNTHPPIRIPLTPSFAE